MSVVLTGDVHQSLSSASDQRFTPHSESELAVRYAQIAARHNLKVTLFITGRAVIEDDGTAAVLKELENVEIGAHGWDAFRPVWWHRALSLATGSPHGPARLQWRMVQRTCKVIRELTGKPVRSWRNHAYRHDRHTPYLLSRAGMTTWSDEVSLESRGPYRHPAGITSLPINTLPDHENLLHGARTANSLPRQQAATALSGEQWCERVCTQVDAVLDQGGTATLLAHPICMEICDNWSSFERLCARLERYPSLFASETAARLEK